MLCLLWSTALAGDWATVPMQDGFAVSLEEDAVGVDALGRPHIVWGDPDTRDPMVAAAPNGFCTWTVRFVPDRVGARVATLRVAPGFVVPLGGEAVGVFDTSGCTDGGCGSCQQGAPAPWGLAVALLWLVRRRR